MSERRDDGDLVDPDGDPRDARLRTARGDAAVCAVIGVGGVIGAEARYGLTTAMPHAGTAWPWSTLVINVVGSLLIGALMVVVVRRAPHPLVRPFAGIGVLGGFTTFSTFVVDNQHLLLAARPGVALGYDAASLVGCLAATALAVAVTRRLVPEPGR